MRVYHLLLILLILKFKILPMCFLSKYIGFFLQKFVAIYIKIGHIVLLTNMVFYAIICVKFLYPLRLTEKVDNHCGTKDISADRLGALNFKGQVRSFCF